MSEMQNQQIAAELSEQEQIRREKLQKLVDSQTHTQKQKLLLHTKWLDLLQV